MARIYLSATRKSAGKTVISIGLCAALRARGLSVQPFKKGPDYIDAMWLSAAAGHACYNLDFNTMSDREIGATFARSEDTDIAIIEGTKGLHDGVALDGSDSNAALANRLDTPVLLIVDCQGMTRGIAALLQGMQSFDPCVRIVGVILNQTAGIRHAAKLNAAVKEYTDVPVLGTLPRTPAIEIRERHLGLIPVNETDEVEQHINSIREAVEDTLNIDAIYDAACRVDPLPDMRSAVRIQTRSSRVKLGVLRDRAFGFYYPDDLENLALAGADLVFIDALTQSRLPPIDGLFIGGGFPETQLDKLHNNSSLRGKIKRLVDTGLPVYAECGGLMYLARSLSWRGKVAEMVGALPLDCVMLGRPQGRGYVKLQTTGRSPWSVLQGAAESFNAHEFHYSVVENIGTGVEYAYRVLRGHGIDGAHDGIVCGNTLASYA
ncbi:MAG: hydrogenobyrinic acid a,c-diamide synthase (glutamine-hydrolyzing), partial [Gammaproteobacteria bacterium]|nr:hydrogenobyrinic acid a,c-diamide synthase (glutamine-hydrolyzing) [Gammaproteobacteria bacterium]